MEISILKEDKDTISISIEKQGHTICNVIRNELVNSEDVETAGYNLKHPQASIAYLDVTVNKGKPRKVIQESVDSLKLKIKEMKNLLKKL